MCLKKLVLNAFKTAKSSFAVLLHDPCRNKEKDSFLHEQGYIEKAAYQETRHLDNQNRQYLWRILFECHPAALHLVFHEDQ